MKTSNTFQSIFLIGFFVSVFLLPGCSSSKLTKFSKPDVSLEDARFVVRTVSVVVDHVKEEEIGWQVNSSAQFFLSQSLFHTGNEYRIDISIIQRSYIKNLSIHNSIYALAMVKDENGETAVMREYYLEGKKSIVAADVQNTVVKKLLSSLMPEAKKGFFDFLKPKGKKKS